MANILIIPAFNETETITLLLRNILSLSLIDLDILVIDDHSTDQTAKDVVVFAQQTAHVKLLENSYPDHGLANCYKTGFAHALVKGYEKIVMMDADFSHDPSDIDSLLKESSGADWVIGSRYVPGGCAKGLGVFRFLLSFWANVLIRKKTKTAIHDLTSGFNCIKRSVLERVDFLSIPSKNFIFQAELKLLAEKSGFRFKEVPIVFHRRCAGRSKFSLQVALEAIARIRALN